MSANYELTLSDKEILRITTFGNEQNHDKDCIILVHGFKGFKDWGFGPYIGKYLSERGCFVITFNFSHNGVGNEPLEFTELDKFAANTFSREVRELSELIDAYKNGFFGNVNGNKLGLIGHSRGGAVSLLTARQKDEVDAVATWSAVSKLDRYTERQKEEWRKNGVFKVKNMRTNQVMPLNLTLLEDIEKNGDDLLNLEKAAKEINRPWLIAHGEQDLAVKIEEAERYYEWSDKSKTELFKLAATGHTFDAKHPFEGTTDKLEMLLEKTYNFFSNNLNR